MSYSTMPPSTPERGQPGVRTYRGRSLQELIPQIREELGPDAIILRQREGLTGGVAGFFAQRCVEVDARPGATVDVYDDELDDLDEVVEPEAVEELAEVGEDPGQELDPLASFAASLERAHHTEAFEPAPVRAALGAVDLERAARTAAEAEKLAAAKRAAAEMAQAAEEQARREAEAEAEQERLEAEARAERERLEAEARAELERLEAEARAERDRAERERLEAESLAEREREAEARAELQTERVAQLEAQLSAEREARRVAELEAQLAGERAAREMAEREARSAAERAAGAAPAPAPAVADAPAPPPAPAAYWPRRGGLLAALTERYLNATLAPAPAAPAPAAIPAPAPVPQPRVSMAPVAAVPAPEAPADAPSPDVLAPVIEELVRAGMSEAWARQLVGDVTRMGSDGAETLRTRTRLALAAGLPTAEPPVAAGTVIALVGGGGAGKTRCAAALAVAYAGVSHRPVAVASLAGEAQQRELRELIRGSAVRHVDAARERALRSAREAGLLILDTPAGDPDALASLSGGLGAMAPDAVLLALPATLSPQAAAAALRRHRVLGVSAIAVTHLDEADQLGAAVELSLESGIPLAYLHEGLDLARAVTPADPALIARRILPPGEPRP